MQQIERQRSNSSSNEDRQVKKICVTTVDTNSASQKGVACLEDLSNELLYEIFEYLDCYHVYEAFFSLNTHFHNLLAKSALHIHLSIISKSAFQRYNKDIIIPNQHRIISLYISTIGFYYDRTSPIHHVSRFRQLETLQILNFESDHLDDFLHALASLSHLSSLTIRSAGCIQDTDLIYLRIFQLPSLKYCNCSLKQATEKGFLLAVTNTYSPIEHLIINNGIYIEQVNSLLSYVPRLRRLRLRSVWQSYRTAWTKTCSSVLSDLTHLSLDLIGCKFDQFEQMISNIVHRIEVLRITVGFDTGRTYTDANRWQRWILSHMPKLRILDFQNGSWPHEDTTNDNNMHQSALTKPIDQFKTAFWTERKWFFTQQTNQSFEGSWATFYSTDPYRRKSYTLYDRINERTCVNSSETSLSSVRHVKIYREKDIIECHHYFPNATQVTFELEFRATSHSIAPMLGRILPLHQLTKLVLEFCCLPFTILIDLLCFAPRLRTLLIRTISQDEITQAPAPDSETFQLASRTNTITNMTFTERWTLDQLQLFLALCPRLKHLAIGTYDSDLQSVIKLLLNKTNPNARDLFSLCLLSASADSLTIVEDVIKSETLLDDYLLRIVSGYLCLWW